MKIWFIERWQDAKKAGIFLSQNYTAIYYVELESGGNDFKSCSSVQIFTKHSTELLTEYQFCFFSNNNRKFFCEDFLKEEEILLLKFTFVLKSSFL